MFLAAWRCFGGILPARPIGCGIQLHESCGLATRRINGRRPGWWIRRHAGRIFDGMRIVRAGGNASAESWGIEVVETVSPVSTVNVAPVARTVRGDTEAYSRASRGT